MPGNVFKFMNRDMKLITMYMYMFFASLSYWDTIERVKYHPSPRTRTLWLNFLSKRFCAGILFVLLFHFTHTEGHCYRLGDNSEHITSVVVLQCKSEGCQHGPVVSMLDL